MALALAQRHDGIAGRVLAFAGRYARLPELALQHTTLHLLHGSADAVIPVDEARRALERLAEIGADATLDIVEGAGHEISAAMLDCALHRLRSHIPHRTWAAALGQVPGAGRRARHDDDDHED
jgi:phospholipase/carboxylesterase